MYRILDLKEVRLERPKTATIGLSIANAGGKSIDIVTFTLHQGLPYKVVEWEGSIARCVVATYEEVDALQRRLAELGLLNHFFA